jgi:tripartite-type tricarboxylate transporter receptor subunit TctC
VIAKVNAAENAHLKLPETQAAVANLGLEAQPLSPQEFGAVMSEQVQLWEKVAREAGVRLD